MRQLMNAKNGNQIVDFELNLKLCDSEVEMCTETSKTSTFDPIYPEGVYALKLEKQYD